MQGGAAQHGTLWGGGGAGRWVTSRMLEGATRAKAGWAGRLFPAPGTVRVRDSRGQRTLGSAGGGAGRGDAGIVRGGWGHGFAVSGSNSGEGRSGSAGSTSGRVSEELQGSVERVAFRSEESGYAVLRVACPRGGRGGGKRKVTVVGQLISLQVGQSVLFRGDWGRHAKHGRQFQADSFEEQDPCQEQDIIAYLKGTLKGVGPVMAKNLADKFGERALEVLDDPEAVHKLILVKGIGMKTALRLKENWDLSRGSREAVDFLQRCGVSVALAQRIVAAHGAQTEELVVRDAFAALRGIKGAGFHEAEALAAEIGLSETLPSRLEAAVLHALELGVARGGHTYLSWQRLSEDAVRLLQSSGRGSVKGGARTSSEMLQELEEAAGRLSSSGDLHIEAPQDRWDPTGTNSGSSTQLLPGDDLYEPPIDPQSRCYLPKMLAAEQLVVGFLSERLQRPHESADEGRVNSWIDRWTESVGLELSPPQRMCVLASASTRTMIITGGPGCGKTISAQAVVRLWKAMGKEVKLCAPTGRAAQRLFEATGHEAQTIHRLLEFEGSSKIDNSPGAKGEPAPGGFVRGPGNPLEADAILVDECSMLDLPLAAAFFAAVPPDTQVVLVGDADQLPPVGPGAVFRDLLASGAVPTCELSEVFRQAQQSAIITSAHDINQGNFPASMARMRGEDLAVKAAARGAPAPALDSDCLWIEVGQEEDVPRGVTLAVEGLMPALGRSSEQTDNLQVLSPVRKTCAGTEHLNRELQALMNPPARGKPEVVRGGGTFRVGDRVLQTENNYDEAVFNGDLGRVTKAEPQEGRLWVAFPSAGAGQDHVVQYSGRLLEQLQLAWAITVHKAQGSEYPAVVIPLCLNQRPLLNRRILYTGLSRARQLAVIVATRQALDLAVQHTGDERRQSMLSTKLEGALGRGAATSQPAPTHAPVTMAAPWLDAVAAAGGSGGTILGGAAPFPLPPVADPWTSPDTDLSPL